MAWRIHENLVDGEMDNTTPGRVTGTLRFVGAGEDVTLDLEGDFSGSLKGRRIRLENPDAAERNRSLDRPGSYMDGFDRRQEGKVGVIEAVGGGGTGLLHASWYSANGRVVLELPAGAWEVAESD
jgi:hypothetical protein